MNLLEDIAINQASFIMHNETGRPYLDEEGACHVFISAKEARAFVKEKENVTASPPRFTEFRSAARTGFAGGAKALVLHAGAETSQAALSERDIARGFYNNQANRTLCMLKQTRKKRWLAELSKCHFLIPAKIDRKDGITILYGIVTRSDSDDFLYLAFTDLDEYGLWAQKVEGWEPLKVGYHALHQIARNNGIMLNLYGNRFIVSKKMLGRIPDPEETAEDKENKEGS